MTAPAWMPFHIGPYVADTGHLSTLAHGAYLLLIIHYWQNDGLPTNDEELARIVRLSASEWAGIRGSLFKLFKAGEWRHKRIDAELATAREMISKRSVAGKAGAEARYGKRMAAARQSRNNRTVDRIASADQTDSIVRVGYHNQEEKGATEEGRTPASETIIVSPTLEASPIVRRTA